MELFAESRKELRAYFTSALGLAAQSYDPRGQGSDSDLSGTMWTRIADERRLKAVREHVATERTLYECSVKSRTILRAAFEPRELQREAIRRGRNSKPMSPKQISDARALEEKKCGELFGHKARKIVPGKEPEEASTTESARLVMLTELGRATFINGLSSTRDLRTVSVDKVRSIRSQCASLETVALTEYEERRLARVDAERAEAAQAKARREATIEATRARVKRASNRPAIFTEEEADTIRRLVSGL